MEENKLARAVRKLDEAADAVASSKLFNRLLHITLFGGAFYVSVNPELGYLAPLFQAAGQYIQSVR